MRRSAALGPDRLQPWLGEQRWFASKGNQSAAAVVELVTISEDPPLAVALVEVRRPLGPAAPGPGAGAGARTLYQVIVADASPDALEDPQARTALAELLLSGESVTDAGGTVDFHWPDADMAGRRSPMARLMGAEQSNSSLLIDERVVLKLFRRLEPGTNPELEMLHFLGGRGFTQAPRLRGWIDLRSETIDATLGVAQDFIAGGHDGWELTLDALEQGDDSTEDLRMLGEVVGSMHRALGSDARHPSFAPEEPSTEWTVLLAVALEHRIDDVFARFPPWPALEPLTGRKEEIKALLDAWSRCPSTGWLIRTHGDLHLGQVLRTPDSWVVLDFEGEPARPIADRRRKRPPLRDVAGMLRSFAYAASAVELQRGRPAPLGWEDRARVSFLEGYLAAVDLALLPNDRAAVDQLLAMFELEKVLYELDYEIQSRPEWVAIPVAGLCRLLDQQTS